MRFARKGAKGWVNRERKEKRDAEKMGNDSKRKRGGREARREEK